MGTSQVATVRMLAFAGARDAIGAAEVELPWGEVVGFARAARRPVAARHAAGGPRAPADAAPADAAPADAATADDLLALACARWPALAPFRTCLRVAVNGTYASASDPVAAGDEVALIPPVAGG